MTALCDALTLGLVLALAALGVRLAFRVLRIVDVGVDGTFAFSAVVTALLATLYFLPAWLLGFFVNRDLNFRRSWKLSGAVVLPGALLMAAGVVLYDLGAVDLVQFGFIFAAHLALGWIYLFVSLLFVPAIPTALPKGNPFVARN